MHPAPRHATAPTTGSMRGASDRTPTTRDRTRREVPPCVYLAAAAFSAVLVPIVTALGASLEGTHALGRVAVAATIAMLAGLAIAASAAGINAADRRCRGTAGGYRDSALGRGRGACCDVHDTPLIAAPRRSRCCSRPVDADRANPFSTTPMSDHEHTPPESGPVAPHLHPSGEAGELSRADGEPHDGESDEPNADPRTTTPASPSADDGRVPEKQLERWKDDGGAEFPPVWPDRAE